MEGVKNVIQRLEPDIDRQIKAINQILIYRDKLDSFSIAIAQRAVHQTNPAEWWIHYGMSTPELQRIAIKVLSQTTSASNCERNWSTFSLIHTKTRNRLKYLKLNKLVYVYYNMRLRIRHATRRSQREIDEQFNPINLDYIFEEDDPLAQWLQERENPLLDGQDNSEWLDVSNDGDDDDDDDDDDGGGGSGGRSSQRQNSSESGTGSALSPPSSDEGNTGGGSGGYYQGAGSGSGHGDENSSHYGTDFGIHGFRDNEDIGEERQPLPRSSSPIIYRRRGHRSSDENYDDHPVLHQFEGLRFGGQDQGSHTQHFLPQLQHYPPQRPSMPYPPLHHYHPPDPPLMAYPPPPPQRHSDMFGLFGPSIPQGYAYPYAESSSSSAPSGNPPQLQQFEQIFTYVPYGQAQQDNEDDEDSYQDPPRHSFWA